MDDGPKFVRGHVIKKIIGVSDWTLRQWADSGKIESFVSPGGQRLYKIPNIESVPKERKGIVYARVSTAKQRSDLKRQIDHLKTSFPDHEVVSDVASGINWKRKGLLSLLERANEGDICEIAVAARDRLCRFAFELLEKVFEMHDVRITVLDSEDCSPEQELSDDLLSIVQIFCCRKNGRRRYGIKSGDEKDWDPEIQEDKNSPEQIAEETP